MPEYQFVDNLDSLIGAIQPESILSRTYLQKEKFKAILFGFASGQELSEHTASVPAVIHFLSGEADLTLGSDQYKVQAGAWAYMPAGLPHSIKAATEVKMLLLMLG